MEPTEENKQAAAAPNKGIIAVIVLLVVLIIAVIAAVFVLRKDNKNDNMTIGYATEATVMLDQDSLQAAMDKAMENAAKGNVALRYVNNAYSADGTVFNCYIANSEANAYDMYLQIFADPEMTDQIFLSGLIPPGSGFEEITLDHALPDGDTMVYVAVTQVETTESGAQTIRNQVVHTMDFHVGEIELEE